MADEKRDDELESVLGEITRVLESGRRIDTEEYVERYPGLAPELKRFFKTRRLEAGDRETGLSAGSVIDDFRIVREIGRGGMGVVYEAEQLSLARRVALKVLPPGLLAGKNTIDRFRREASAVARLSHPRIVAVHGLNQAGAIAYLAMEYIDGLDLAEIIDRLRTAVVKAFEDPELKETWFKLGAEPGGSTPEGFRDLVSKDIAKWGKVVREAGVTIE